MRKLLNYISSVEFLRSLRTFLVTVLITTVALWAIYTHFFTDKTFAEAVFGDIFPTYFGEKAPEPVAAEPFEVEMEPPEMDEEDLPEAESLLLPGEKLVTMENIKSFSAYEIVRRYLYTVDRMAYVSREMLDFDKLLTYDFKTDLKGKKPKVLIFHTHSQEAFIDSREGVDADTIVGVGDYLANILTENYGIPVLHHKGVYDVENGVESRGGSYEKMEPDIRKVLKENPSIEVVIDLHRDAIGLTKRLLTTINDEPTATIMFFNGVCTLNDNGEPLPTEGLENEYLEQNLALSLKLKLLANEKFPGFTRKNYIKPYRYSLHMLPNSLLIEVGSSGNTVKEAKNAMIPLAELLVETFT